ncbi:MAG: endolytic transglycosylase MltG, partial [Chloroflexi bacterium]|nr:endolytic transglycosylase MltG [Chloroflexota bacterium]
EFDRQVIPGLQEQFRLNGLDLSQAVTLASIVERESVVDDEKPLIASVFLNRLNNGMKLDSDPTVQYAIGYREDQLSWWTNPLTAADLNVNSPYNTYLNPGLPPGPISNPGLEALRAVAYPAQTPYFYFRALCDNSGRHVFSATYAEHLQNACSQ